MVNTLQAVNYVKNIRLLIEYDENVGFYLLVYDLASGKCIKDHHFFHNELDNLYRKAKNEYDISRGSFYEINKTKDEDKEEPV